MVSECWLSCKSGNPDWKAWGMRYHILKALFNDFHQRWWHPSSFLLQSKPGSNFAPTLAHSHFFVTAVLREGVHVQKYSKYSSVCTAFIYHHLSIISQLNRIWIILWYIYIHMPEKMKLDGAESSVFTLTPAAFVSTDTHPRPRHLDPSGYTFSDLI